MQKMSSILVASIVLIPLLIGLFRLAVSPAVRAVFLRNVRSYFSGILGYLFIVVFVVLAALLAFNQQFFTNNLATLDQLTAAFPMLLLFLVPAITMTSWSEERKLGTDELLFTLPASDLDILIGKYLSVLSVYTIALGFSITNLYVLARMGTPDWGPILSTYFGYWLAGAALLTAGLLTSSLTSSATVAFVLGAALCALPVFIDRIPQRAFGILDLPRETIAQLSMNAQLRDFGLGMIPLSGVLYFVSLAILMLYLNYIVIRRRHWSGGEHAGMGFQYAIRGASVAALLLGVNLLAQGAMVRADLTEGKIYSLSATTRQVIAEMSPERPVMIQAFVSPSVPREYVPVRKRLLGLLRQYDEMGGGKITVRIVDVEPFSESTDEAAAFGLSPRTVVSSRDGRQIQEDIFLGVVFSSSYDEVIIPTLGPGSSIEYELTRSLRTVSKAERLTVGVLQTDANVIGGQTDWEIVRELRLQYDVESVSPASPIDAAKYDVLVAVMPSSLTDEEMVNFLDYVEAGRPTLIFDDPYPLQLNPPNRISIAPRLPKPSPGGMFGQQQPPTPKADEGKLTQLMNYLNISWSYDSVLWDDFNPHPGFGDQLPDEYLFIGNQSTNPEALSSESPITSGLQEVFLAYAGEIRNRANSPYEFTSLLETGAGSGILLWEQFAQQSFNPMTFQPDFELNRSPRYLMDPSVHCTAAQIKGKEGGPNVIFVADIDMISDFFFQLRLVSTELTFDNISFILNAIDTLAGDDAYISLRNRRETRATLTAVEEQTSVFRQQLRDQEKIAEENLESEIQKRQAQLDATREEIESDTSLSARAREERLQMALQNEQRRLAVFRQEQEKLLEQEKSRLNDQTNRKIQETENSFWTRAVLIPPIPAVILGLFVLLVRMLRERREIEPARHARSRATSQ